MKRTLIHILLFIIISLTNSLKLNAQEINCLDCHENLVEKTVHDKVIKCSDCHNDIITEDHSEQKAKKVDCKKCHAALQAQMEDDVHRKLMHLPEDKAPDCKTCHGTHKIINPSTVSNKEKMYCSKCHTKSILLAPYHNLPKQNESCNNCHSNKNHKAELAKSVHKNLSCSNCHSYVVNNLQNHQKAPKEGVVADCYLCHNAIALEHKESIHGISLTEGINEAAQCWNCHGSHDIYPVKDKNSKVYSSNLVATCSKCHDNPEFIKKYSLSLNQPGKMYTTSVHGKLVQAGSKNAATCVTCHGKHNIKNRVQPGSTINSLNLPNTCAECHKSVVDEYKQSIHWIAVKKGIRSAPTCNDCHSEHNIQSINTADKRNEIRKIQDNTCLQCHNNILLSQRYGVEKNNVTNYKDSYHGMAVKRGDERAAMCVDCHNPHKILPKSHPESSINEKNILKTCTKCHTNASQTFANSYSHTTQDSVAVNIESMVKMVYFWVIIIVIGGMFLHNMLILIHELQVRYKKSKDQIRIPRFTRNELIQHTTLLTSFIILALTGFMLKYPDSVFGKLMISIGFTEVIRQWVHRISAVVMIILSFYHAIYLVFTARGRDVLFGLFPRFSDLTQGINTVLYYMHLTKKHPEYDNYNYIEKMEYWALIWGTMVMGFTGLVLWFPTIVGNWAPVWLIKVSEIVHFYEAVLATLAIVVWHWFFVIFHPKEYPVSFTVFNGETSVVHFKGEHRLKYHKVILEYLEIKNGKRKLKKMSSYTRLFINAIEKNGLSMEEFVRSELANDNKLKEFIKTHGLA